MLGPPKITIGVPVYNGAAGLAAALESILSQSFRNFEMIISDNGSTDATATIAEEYVVKDKRIRYIRQPINLGAMANFRFVLEQACTPYFMWAAADDIRSPDFLHENFSYLEAHPECVASTSPNTFGSFGHEKPVVFGLYGSAEERFQQFFKHCWLSHGIFYSLMRTNVIQACDLVGQSFIAVDWGIDLFLASKGNVHRTEKSLALFGANGISSRANAYAAFRNQPIERVLPFYRLTCYTLKLSAGFGFAARLRLLVVLVKLNLKADLDQLHSALYRFYCEYFKTPSHKKPG